MEIEEKYYTSRAIGIGLCCYGYFFVLMAVLINHLFWYFIAICICLFVVRYTHLADSIKWKFKEKNK